MKRLHLKDAIPPEDQYVRATVIRRDLDPGPRSVSNYWECQLEDGGVIHIDRDQMFQDHKILMRPGLRIWRHDTNHRWAPIWVQI